MDPQFPHYFERELRYVAGAFGEFAQAHPKIAARLGAHAGEVRDIYVDRLLQAFAFSSARMQMRIDRWPADIAVRMLEGVNPNFVAPQPSMGIARFYPDAAASHSRQGLTLPRGTSLTMNPAEFGATRCEFRTTQPVTVWPLSISGVRFTGIPADVPALYRYVYDSEDVGRVRGALRVRLGTLNSTPLATLEGLDRLPVYLCGDERLASHLFELIHTAVVGIVMGEPDAFESGALYGIRRPGYPSMRVEYEGLEPDTSLLPPVRPALHGQMQVHEFFALPSRFWFFAVAGLAAGLANIAGPEVELVLLLDRDVGDLAQSVGAADFALFCAPVVNLFPVTTARLDVAPGKAGQRVTPVADKPTDYVLHSVSLVTGQVGDDSEPILFQPFDAAVTNDTRRDLRYFRLTREAELDDAHRYDTREQFVRTHTRLTLLGPDRTPDDSGVQHLTLHASLTNGDLPCVQRRSREADLVAKDAKSVRSVGFVRGPTAPRPPLASGADGDAAWELVRQLQLELAVFDDAIDEHAPGEGLRLTLRPYLAAGDAAMTRFVDALSGASVKAVYDMHCDGDDIWPMRGLAITLEFDETLLDGWSPFTFALALERYVARHASRHSFVRTTLRTKQRGAVFTWPTREGSRGVL